MELVSIGSPDKGEGITVIVYMTFPVFLGGAHLIATLEKVVPFTISLSLISLGGGTINIMSQLIVTTTWAIANSKSIMLSNLGS